MARFKATIKGQRGESSRLGSKLSGLKAIVNGWNCGVEIKMEYDKKYDEDVIYIYLIRGSNRPQDKIFLGRYCESHIISYFTQKKVDKL